MNTNPDQSNLQTATPRRVVLVTGPSGAGRSTAIKTLEDIGFEAIDNLPLSLLPRLLGGPPLERNMALGIDTRNRDFSTDALIELIDNLATYDGIAGEVLYLDCSATVLVQRFSETRRRHPLAPAESPLTGIERDFDLLRPIRHRADVLIDTSDLNVHQLKAEVQQWFGVPDVKTLAVSVQSFSYKRGLPRGIDTVFDCRFLQNPYWVPALRKLNGTDADVATYVQSDDRFAPFFDRVLDLSQMLLPAYRDEGKTHFSIGFGCTGGQHRSVAVAESLTAALAKDGWQVSIRHRELDRRTEEERRL
jgi:UPF0042 nucleotide-binding protein